MKQLVLQKNIIFFSVWTFCTGKNCMTTQIYSKIKNTHSKMLISDVFTIKAENIYGNDTYIPRRHKQRRLTAKTEWLRPACHLHKIKKVNSTEPFQFIILHKHSSPHINALFHLTICLLHKHSNPHSVSGMNLPLFVVSTQALKHSSALGVILFQLAWTCYSRKQI